MAESSTYRVYKAHGIENSDGSFRAVIWAHIGSEDNEYVLTLSGKFSTSNEAYSAAYHLINAMGLEDSY